MKPYKRVGWKINDSESYKGSCLSSASALCIVGNLQVRVSDHKRVLRCHWQPCIQLVSPTSRHTNNFIISSQKSALIHRLWWKGWMAFSWPEQMWMNVFSLQIKLPGTRVIIEHSTFRSSDLQTGVFTIRPTRVNSEWLLSKMSKVKKSEALERTYMVTPQTWWRWSVCVL
jgi:hypothetical protein